MGLVSGIKEALRFKETVFYKENSDLQKRYDALRKLNEEYPNNEELLNELKTVKIGLDGENEIAYQLKKSDIGMYVLRDVIFKHGDLKAQIDFIVITPVYNYYIECKNLVGNIIVNDKGDFIRELIINGEKIQKGMYSPFRQAEEHREVIRKIWEDNTSVIKKMVASNSFNNYHKVLVVVANHDTILNLDNAPYDMKYKILRADSLVRQIKYDLDHIDKFDYEGSKVNMKKTAQGYLDLSYNEEIDFYEYYKNKYFSNVNNVDLKKD